MRCHRSVRVSHFHVVPFTTEHFPFSLEFLKRRGRKHARQVPPRNCGIAISRKARARQNARPPPRPPTPLRLRHRRDRRGRTTRDISKDNRSPTRSAAHRWAVRDNPNNRSDWPLNHGRDSPLSLRFSLPSHLSPRRSVSLFVRLRVPVHPSIPPTNKRSSIHPSICVHGYPAVDVAYRKVDTGSRNASTVVVPHGGSYAPAAASSPSTSARV